MFTTIPLKSLLQDKTRCISCNKKIRSPIKADYYDVSRYKMGRLISNELYTSSYDVNDIDDHVYDYKCNSCISDREYNMTDKYNITHPIREESLLSWIDVKSPHIIVKGIIQSYNKGEQVNQ